MVQQTIWANVSRPGYLGGRRDEAIRLWDAEYGKGNWRVVWLVNGLELDFLGVCALYEDAYFEFFKSHPEILEELVSEACQVYDDEESNVNSGLDYMDQETRRTHIQDIAIRHCLVRLGRKFEGDKLIRIRQARGTHSLSITLSPGNVPFHRPEWIRQPEEPKWWKPGSVESFYQSNRILQVRTK